MKKLSVLLAVCMIVCSLPIMSFAADVYTTDVTSDGIVTYSNDFESESSNTYSGDKNGIKVTSAGQTKFTIRGNNSQYLEMQQTVENKYPSITINLLKTDANPKINSLANAKKYTVKFKMRVSPGAASNTQMYMDCGARWSFYVNTSGKTFNIKHSTVTAEQTIAYGCTTTFNNDKDDNKFMNYEIDVDRTSNTAATAALKVDGKLMFKNVPQSTDCSFDLLKFTFQKTIGRLAIDNIQVIVTDPATCGDENYAAATNIDFENFGIGMIPNVSDYTVENKKIGGFENANDGYLQKGFAYIDYKYDDTDPSNVNKYLKITKTASGAKPFSVKRDINGVVGDYSVYDVSFKIKNDLGTTASDTAFIRVAGGDNANNGMVAAIRGKDGKVGWFDYAAGSAKDNYSDFTATTGEWTQMKIRVYRDENKADLYAGNMETPIATNIKTNFKCGGNYLVFAPQKSATGSIGIDDIVITPVTKSNYALSYTTGTDDLSKYTTSGVSAQCKVADEITETPVIIIAEYGSDGRLVNIAKSQNKENGIVSASLSGVSAQTGENVSIMLWKSLENPVPLKKLIKLSPAAQ